MAEREQVDVFGTSAKYIDACKKAGLEPARTHDLGRLRAILSTGSPLVPESFDYVYEAIKPDVQLSSISGGTDIVSCFVLGNPAGPVRRGEIQMRGLGLAVDVWDEPGPAGARREGRAGLHQAVPLHAGAVLERPGRHALSATAISRAFPACGATATSPRSPRAAA